MRTPPPVCAPIGACPAVLHSPNLVAQTPPPAGHIDPCARWLAGPRRRQPASTRLPPPDLDTTRRWTCRCPTLYVHTNALWFSKAHRCRSLSLAFNMV